MSQRGAAAHQYLMRPGEEKKAGRSSPAAHVVKFVCGVVQAWNFTKGEEPHQKARMQHWLRTHVHRRSPEAGATGKEGEKEGEGRGEVGEEGGACGCSKSRSLNLCSPTLRSIGYEWQATV
jgi:hypothetical protein